MRLNSATYKSTPRAYAGERADCSVRAIRCAAEVDYAPVYTVLMNLGRESGRRVWPRTMDFACAKFNAFPMPLEGRPTLKQFLKAHKTGRYVLFRKGHYFAVVNGSVHDWTNTSTNSSSRIRNVWEVK